MNAIGASRFRPEDSEKIAKALRGERVIGVDILCSDDVADVVHDVRRYGLYRVETERLKTRVKNSAPDFYGRLAFVTDPENPDGKGTEKRYIDFFLDENGRDGGFSRG